MTHMRFALVLVASLAVAAPRIADACFTQNYGTFELDPSQLSDIVQPGPVDVSVAIESSDGGCAGERTKCGDSTERHLVVIVNATDDRTPPDRMGFRLTVSAGTAPFAMPGDVYAIDDMIRLPIGGAEDFDFELAVRAIDLNGNVGPPTFSRVAEANSGGCAAHHASFGMIAAVLALLVARRRR